MKEYHGFLLYLFGIIFWVNVNCAVIWDNGYYLKEGSCLKWDPTCLTCESNNGWTECQPYMFLNSTTLNCQFWPEGTFYSSPLQTCQDWGVSWIGACMYQEKCFSWPSGEILDLNTLLWVENWSPDTQILINDTQFENKPICRNFDYFVDSSSNKRFLVGIKLNSSIA